MDLHGCGQLNVFTLALALLMASSPDGGTPRGKLSKDEIYAVIKRGRADVRGCYDLTLQIPDACELSDWKVTASWTIARDGSVTNVSIQSDTKFTVLHECIRDVVAHWKFPTPTGGTVDVKYFWLPRITCGE